MKANMKTLLFLAGCFAITQAALFKFASKCCSDGINLATKSNTACHSPPVEDLNLGNMSATDRMSCVSVLEVCCHEARSSLACDVGKAHAIQNGDCGDLPDSAPTSKRECCGCCKLGQVAGQEGLACDVSVLNLQVSEMCATSYAQCCDKMVGNGSSGQTGGQTDGQGQGNGSNGGQGQGDGTQEGGEDETNASQGACGAQNPCDQICTDTGLELQCSCNTGYRLDTDGRTCNDVDECATSDTCAANQLCVNTPGSFRCDDGGNVGTCANGFAYNTRNNRCEDIDECALGGGVCSGRRCVNTIGSYRCDDINSCDDGFRYEPLQSECIDVNECTTGIAVCSFSQMCVNTVGSYRCEGSTTGSCDTGLVRNFVTNRCEDVDECTSGTHNCVRANMDCLNTIGSFLCRCFRGYTFKVETQDCRDINECSLGQDSCLEGQQCVNTVGSYYCRRIISCGTGYLLDERTQGCIDVDECRQGTHNCGDSFECENSPGSFRCNIKQRDCPEGSRLNYRTGICERVVCSTGLRANREFACVDIDECSEGTPCRSDQTCRNTHGSYRCTNRLNCYEGFQPNVAGTFCEDVDECATGAHDCETSGNPPQTCVNEPGRYKCRCPKGFRFNAANKQCEDEDECTRYGGRVCSIHARCENTPGSYRCVCKEGYESSNNGLTCVDKDECQTPRICQHTCLNTYGSFECRCDAGYTLSEDKRTCKDVNECENNMTPYSAPVCIGLCQNTPGSFQCSCPPGYQMGASGRQCQDIDECATGEARCFGERQICVNTRGGYRCNDIQCPPGFYMSSGSRQRGSVRCQRISYFCQDDDQDCKTAPLSYTYNFLTFPSRVNIPADLFTMRSRSAQRFEFDLKLISATGSATRADFSLINVNTNAAMVRLVNKLDGPQEVELQLEMNIYHGNTGTFIGKSIAKIFIYVTKDPWRVITGGSAGSA